jgi:hypothetical protein
MQRVLPLQTILQPPQWELLPLLTLTQPPLQHIPPLQLAPSLLGREHPCVSVTLLDWQPPVEQL